MGHIPDDDSFEEFMDASAEEWSKPEEAPKVPESAPEPADRWGSSTAGKDVVDDGDRWGSEELEPTRKKEEPKKEEKPKQAPAQKPPVKKEKKKPKWWIIAIIVLVVLCLCVCVSIIVLISSGVTLFENLDFGNWFDWTILEDFSY
jgi:hypothetical protein